MVLFGIHSDSAFLWEDFLGGVIVRDALTGSQVQVLGSDYFALCFSLATSAESISFFEFRIIFPYLILSFINRKRNNHNSL